jgi:riboflavin synthase
VFTGIIETTGTLVQTTPVAGGRRLVVDAGIVASDARLGASIAINGICLTVTAIAGAHLSFDAITETLSRTNLGRLRPGARVNLERSIVAGGRMDGHFVQGHVDGTAEVVRRTDSPTEWVLWLRPQAQLRPYLVPKGSVALDGISLTIAAVESDQFSVAIIPTTLQLTALGDRQVGDTINVETDILARIVGHYLSTSGWSGLPALNPTGLTMEKLAEHGFA